MVATEVMKTVRVVEAMDRLGILKTALLIRRKIIREKKAKKAPTMNRQSKMILIIRANPISPPISSREPMMVMEATVVKENNKVRKVM